MQETQLERRRQRALEEGFKIRNVGDHPHFSTFSVLSPSGRTYSVTTRSLKRRINGCTCPDYQTNLLGTCKHIEAVLARLGKKLHGRIDQAERHAPPTAEIFLAYGERVEVSLNAPRELMGKGVALARRFFDPDGHLLGDAPTQVPLLLEALSGLKPGEADHVRVSPEVKAHAQRLLDSRSHARQRDWFLEEVAHGRRTMDVVGAKLYPYQEKGMLHLAFTGRALLADDMGLGKTVQAIGASVLLRELRGIQRVLVVTPASLKHQWMREIRRFTSLSAEVVDGPSSRRNLMYAKPAFFTMVNYELLLRDSEVFEKLAPDLVILDEAQRVKNWRTKTAQSVKRLRSKYVFVLTGTPIENNLDELYSVMQTLDPRLLGPLWQFNARYFQLEKRGKENYKVLGYKNLAELRERIEPVVLRRTRDEVLKDLPPRVDNNYFVKMTPAQLEPYKDYQSTVAQLLSVAKRRALTPRESTILMMSLQKMRILCDALELHDRKIPAKLKKQTAPKLDELAKILQEQVVDGGRKAVIFSSFEGMIDLAIERVAIPMRIDHVKLAGSVPTARRGALLDRFREDKNCKIFFSTDAGGVGLNLQSANLVINLDLPWNPAVLEQRIGRAHRMGQKDTVGVINLVAQGAIEEKMLDTLAQKRQIFQAVFSALDGQDTLVFGKDRGLLARLRQMLQDEQPPAQMPTAVPQSTTDTPDALVGAQAMGSPAPEGAAQSDSRAVAGVAATRAATPTVGPSGSFAGVSVAISATSAASATGASAVAAAGAAGTSASAGPGAPASVAAASLSGPIDDPFAARLRHFADRLNAELGSRLLLVRRVEQAGFAAGPTGDLPRLLVVVDAEAASLATRVDEIAASISSEGPCFALHLFDRRGYENLLGLMGPALAMQAAGSETYRSPALPRPIDPREEARARASGEARVKLQKVEERLRLARLMSDGGFATESLAPLRQAFDAALDGLFTMAVPPDGSRPDRADVMAVERNLVGPGILTADDSARLSWLRGVLSAPGTQTPGIAAAPSAAAVSPASPIPLDASLVARATAAIERLRDAGEVYLTARSL